MTQSSNLREVTMASPLVTAQPTKADQPHKVWWGWWWLFLIFGLGPWLIVNSAVLQVPLMKKHFPEGNAMGSMIGAAVQVGNVAIPLLIALRQANIASTATLTLVSLGIAVVDSLLFVLFWDVNAPKPLNNCFLLLVLCFVGGAVGCGSKVTHFALTAESGDPSLINAVSTGMGISGLFPVLLATAQGSSSNNPHKRFSVSVFMLIVFALLATSLVGLVMFRLRGPGHQTRTHQVQESTTQSTNDSNADPSQIQPHDNADAESIQSYGTNSQQGSVLLPSVVARSSQAPEDLDDQKSALRVLFLERRPLINQIVNSMLNYAVFPGMFSYMRESSNQVFWLTAAYYIANCVGRWLPTVYCSLRLEPFNVIQVLLYAFFLWGCVQSDVEIPFGVLVAALSIFSLVNGYLSTTVAQFVRQCCRPTRREVVYQAVGVCGQVGSVAGTYFTLALALMHVFRLH